MKVIRSIGEMQEIIQKMHEKQIGFVPTMGSFHEGHLSLMNTAKEENDIVITSIFVNPLQFGPDEDYEKYPRNEEQDILLAHDSGVDILFMPDVQTIYPGDMSISMSSKQQANVLCGRSRPGHFNGVITVLTKLFNIIQPSKAYFGMKDAQQLAVVDTLITELNFPIELIGVPTSREIDGLAKSSRNVYLSKKEKKEAVWLYKALTHGRKLVVDGERNPDIIIKGVKELITKETTGTIDYVELLSYPKLKAVTKIDRQVILAIAVHFNQTRLIDNLLFDSNGKAVRRLN